jgi:alkylhydroperoxidase family enzyme
MPIDAGDVRDDLGAAYRTTLAAWARPGSWWTGTQRLAIVEEARRCRAGEELSPWTAPSTVDGLVATDGPLPPVAVDVIWRLTRHPGTLTVDWYHHMIARGIAPLAYLELVAVTAMASAVDAFTRALGFDLSPLPDPEPGQPSAMVPADAAVTTHWVPTVGDAGLNVVRATTAVPQEHQTLRALVDAQYVPAQALTGDLGWSRGTLDRRQIELIAARTSMRNDCFY